MSMADQPVPGIKEFFKGRSIFITGATGFMGKVLIEKLLRTCQEVKAVYILLRSKPNMEPGQRIEALLRAKVFDRLKEEHPEALAKLVAISGDISKEGLDLSVEDEKLLVTEVSVVVHMAASVRFDEKLQKAMDLNVDGTRRVLDLSSKMHHLSALVHVSTAYSYCDKEVIEEVVYPLPYNPRKVSEALQWMDDDLISSITPQLLNKHPNTYVFTKAMSEQLVTEEYSHLPIAILRPSLVSPSLKEPFPGWIENITAPVAYTIGYAKGVIRCMYMNEDKVFDLIPVDTSINMLISTIWYTATHRSNNVLVFNGNHIQLKTAKMMELLNAQLFSKPVSGVVWYPSMTICRNRFYYKILSTLIRLFPLLFLDAILWLTGRKPMLLQVFRKFEKAYSIQSFFSFRDWKFNNDNVSMLWELMTPQDRQDFDFDFRILNVEKYAGHYYEGIKLYFLKEDPSELPAARRHLTRMHLLFILSHIIGAVIVWQLLMAVWG